MSAGYPFWWFGWDGVNYPLQFVNDSVLDDDVGPNNRDPVDERPAVDGGNS